MNMSFIKGRTLSVLTLMLTLVVGSPGAAEPAAERSIVLYAKPPASLNYLYNNRETTIQHVSNMVDGLVEHDRFGILRPALAEAWHANDDFTVWTFILRKGVYWVGSDLAPHAEVTAGDWVDALRYMLDYGSAHAARFDGVIKNAGAYRSGLIGDFSKVGVRAAGPHVLEYTLEKPIPWFDTLLADTAFYPAPGDALRQKGRAFGALEPDGILCNGAYVLVQVEHGPAGPALVYEANPYYWDRERVSIERIRLEPFKPQDPEVLLEMLATGPIAALPLEGADARLISLAKERYGDCIFETFSHPASFFLTFFLGQGSEPASRGRAVLNRNVRKALFFGMNRKALVDARTKAGDVSAVLRSSFTPPGLSFDPEGRDYQDYLAKALSQKNPFDFPQDISLADSQDPFYNPAKALSYMAKAREELAGQGIALPMTITVPADSASSGDIAMKRRLKEELEALFGSDTIAVSIEVMAPDDIDALLSRMGGGIAKDRALDMVPVLGWNAEYGDPSAFLDALSLPDGPLWALMGLDEAGLQEPAYASLAEVQRFYWEKLSSAKAEGADMYRRMELFGEAEAILLDEAYILPLFALGGSLQVSRIQPWTAPYAWYGADRYKLKGISVRREPFCLAERESLFSEWESLRLAAYREKDDQRQVLLRARR